MSRYAEKTSVGVETSRMEIERTLQRYGAPGDGFAYGRKGSSAYIGFEFHGRQFRIVLPLPDPQDRKFHFTPEKSFKRTADQAQREWEQACRQACHDLYQSRITNLLEDFGWSWHHQFDSRRSRSGWPDIAAWRPGRVIVIEVKVAGDNLSAEQYFCLLSLAEAGVDCYVWWPQDWPEAEVVISGMGTYELAEPPAAELSTTTRAEEVPEIPDRITAAEYRELVRTGRI